MDARGAGVESGREGGGEAGEEVQDREGQWEMEIQESVIVNNRQKNLAKRSKMGALASGNT